MQGNMEYVVGEKVTRLFEKATKKEDASYHVLLFWWCTNARRNDSSDANVVLTEKGAMIGFAGPRVIEQNTEKKLPEGFQAAEFQKEHRFVDTILERENEKKF